jgi:hypothetical protein
MQGSQVFSSLDVQFQRGSVLLDKFVFVPYLIGQRALLVVVGPLRDGIVVA